MKTQQYLGSASTFNEFCSLVDLFPDDVKSVSVQSSLDLFNPKQAIFSPSSPDWKQQIKNLVESTLQLRGGDEIDTFRIQSYFGGKSTGDICYIQLISPKQRQFNADMSAGVYGRLD
jgi:hypothetical protein